jgi:small subunit ribosomal protein S20
LANKQSAIKRLRSAGRRRQHNQIYRGQARTAVKKARLLIDQGHVKDAREAVHVAVSALDKAAEKGKNNAARRKSRLMRQLNQIEHAF